MRTYWIATPMAIAMAFLLAACGSSASSSSASSNGGSSSVGTSEAAGVAAAKSIVAAATPPPTKIPQTVPLPKAPAEGTKVALLQCAPAACTLLNPGFLAAARSLGWDPTIIPYAAANPGQAVQQAINDGNKYIASTSIALGSIGPQLQEMKARHIGWFEGYTTDMPEGASNGLYGNVANATFLGESGKLLADYMIADSNGHSNSVYISLPLYPATVMTEAGLTAELRAKCPDCTNATLPTSVAQLGEGQLPAAIVTYLRSHPDTDYVVLSFQDLFPGLAPALKSAGLASKVKIIGSQPQAPELDAVANGTSAAWVMLPEPYLSWAFVDWMARLSEGELSAAALNAGDQAVQYLVDSPEGAEAALKANSNYWPGPAGYAQQFESLWRIGG
jgi:ribose transport system substrate-binding protein